MATYQGGGFFYNGEDEYYDPVEAARIDPAFAGLADQRASNAAVASAVTPNNGAQSGGWTFQDFLKYNADNAPREYADWPTDARIQYDRYLSGYYGDDAATAKNFGFKAPVTQAESQRYSTLANQAAEGIAGPQGQGSNGGDGVLGLGTAGDLAALAIGGYFAWPYLTGAAAGAGGAGAAEATAAGAGGAAGGVAGGTGLTLGGTGAGLALPGSLGGTATGLGLSSSTAGTGFSSGLAGLGAAGAGLASQLSPVADGLTSAGVASGLTSMAGGGAGVAGTVPGTVGAASAVGSGMGPGLTNTGVTPGNGGQTIPGSTPGSSLLDKAGEAVKAAAGAAGADWMKSLTTALGGILDAYGANEQTQALTDLAHEQMAKEDARYADLKAREDAAIARQRADIQFGRDVGQPSRNRYEGSYAPGFTMSSDPGYKDALDATARATGNALSVNFGNPGGSNNAQAQTLKTLYDTTAYPALQDYRKLNATTGGYGSYGTSGAAVPGITSGLSTTVPTGGAEIAKSSIGSLGDIYSSIGNTVGRLTTPDSNSSLQDMLKKLSAGNGSIFDYVKG